MRCALATIGSRGDVEPFVLLAAALAERGHDVTLALDAGHHALVSPRARVRVTALGELQPAQMLDAVARAVAATSPDERSRIGYRAFIGHREPALRDRLTELARDHELLVIGDALTFFAGAELPWPTATAIVWYTLGPDSEYARLGELACLRLAALPSFVAPRDPALAARVRFTGFWRRAASSALPARVAQFLDAGEAPLFLTMGSMAGFDAAALVTRFVAAARAHGRRAIVQRGWAGLDAPAAPDVCPVDEVDYAALFPRCAALFVHGGAGTIGHALFAGKPIAVLPLVADQVAWARVIASLGSGLGTVDPRAAGDDLSAAVGRARDPAILAAATRVAAERAREPGLDGACALLEKWAADNS